jgi:hypothetical protein
MLDVGFVGYSNRSLLQPQSGRALPVLAKVSTPWGDKSSDSSGCDLGFLDAKLGHSEFFEDIVQTLISHSSSACNFGWLLQALNAPCRELHSDQIQTRK